MAALRQDNDRPVHIEVHATPIVEGAREAEGVTVFDGSLDRAGVPVVLAGDIMILSSAVAPDDGFADMDPRHGRHIAKVDHVDKGQPGRRGCRGRIGHLRFARKTRNDALDDGLAGRTRA